MAGSTLMPAQPASLTDEPATMPAQEPDVTDPVARLAFHGMSHTC